MPIRQETSEVAELARLIVARFRAGHPHAERYLSELRQTRAGEARHVLEAVDGMLRLRSGRLGEAVKPAGGPALSAAVQWYQGRAEALKWFTEGLPGVYALAEAALARGEAAAAEQAYAQLAPDAHLPVMTEDADACFGSAEHGLGVAALALGRVDLAVAHLRAAVQANLALGHLPAATLARARLGQALQARMSGDDAVVARRELELARRDARELGMTLVRPSYPDSGVLRLEREPGGWRVALGPREAWVEGSVGMEYLAVLVGNPGYEVTAVELTVHSRLRDSIASDGDPEVVRARLAEPEVWLAQVDAERARIAVGKAIRRAIEHVEQVEPVIAARLRASVQTGLRCCYRPY